MKTICILMLALALAAMLQAQMPDQHFVRCLTFSHSNNYVQLPESGSFNLPTSMTVEAWIFPSSWNKVFQAIVTKGDTNWRLQRFESTNRVAFTIGSGGTYTVQTDDIAAGTWTHIAAVKNGSFMGIYVNGVLHGSRNDAPSTPTSSARVRIGSNADMSNREFFGQMDEVRIWNIARTGAQLKANRYNHLDPNTPGLVAYYKMDSTSGTTAYDETSNNFHGTLHNFSGNYWNASWVAQRILTTDDRSFHFANDDEDITFAPLWESVPSQFTAEVWFKPEEITPTEQVVLYHGDNLEFKITTLMDNIIAGVRISSGGTDEWLTFTFEGYQPGQWYHGALVGDISGNCVFYLNGAVINTHSPPVGSSFYDPGPEFAGSIGSIQGTSQWFRGMIDEIRIWDLARTAQEIWDNRHHTIDPETSGLIAYYNFKELPSLYYMARIIFNRVNIEAIGISHAVITSNDQRVDATWPEGQNYLGGPINADTVWQAGEFDIWSDIIIPSGVKLTISPGTTLSFINHFGFLIDGTLHAVGTPADSIRFTYHDPSGFDVPMGGPMTTTGAWNGIVIQTTADSDSTLLKHCSLEYSKATERYIGSTAEQNIGGAILVNGTGRFRIEDCRISNNIAADKGGGIALKNVTGGFIKRCRIHNNRVTNTPTGHETSVGGAIYVFNCRVDIIDCHIVHNEAANSGGGIFTNTSGDDSQTVIRSSYIAHNAALVRGGGICLYYTHNNTRVIRNHIEYNTAEYGGGIACHNPGWSLHMFPYIQNNVINHNEAEWGGGMFFFWVQNIDDQKIHNNTVVYNTAFQGGGGMFLGQYAVPWIRNHIIWYNSAPEGEQIYLETTTSDPRIRYSNVQGGKAGIGGAGASSYQDTRYVNCIDVIPMLESEPGEPYKLHPASPCINRGEPDSYADALDFAGNPRVFQIDYTAPPAYHDILNRIDIGAYEDQSDRGVIPYDITHPPAMYLRNITIPHGVTMTLDDSMMMFDPGYGIDIYGSLRSTHVANPYASGNHMSAGNPDLGWRGLSFLGTNTVSDSSNVEYLRIVNATKSGADYPAGGGIYVNGYDNLIMKNFILDTCSADKGGGLGIYNSSAEFYGGMLRDCTALSDGGGVYLEDSSALLAQLTIVDNSSISGAGGISAINSANAQVMGCLIWNNGANPITGAMNVYFSLVEGGYPGDTNIDADPKIIRDNLYRRITLQSTSPCLNKGIVDAGSYPNMPSRDIMGNPRIHSHSSSIYDRMDIGAYEYPGLMDVSNVQASDGDNSYPGYVFITWDFDTSYQPFNGFYIYRDGIVIHTLFSPICEYRDYSAIPGEMHLYGVQAFAGNESSQLITDIGFIKPNGIITGSVKTPNNNPVAGVKVSLSPSLGHSLFTDGNGFLYADIPILNFNNSFTLETWIKTLSSDCDILMKFSYDQDTEDWTEMSLKIDEEGLLLFTDGLNTLTQQSGAAVNDNVWHHVAITYDAALEQGCLFLDGVCVADASVTFSDGAYDENGITNDFEGVYVGHLDDIRIWDYARTAEQIADNSEVILASNTPGLIAYYPLNEGQGNTAYDATDNAHHAEIHFLSWSSDEPGIALGGVTNVWGEYVIEQIPYGTYTTFTVTPSKPGHFFQPEQRLITLSQYSISANNVDFVDNSLIPISGRVRFVNTEVPVRNASILLNGQLTAPPTLTDDQGYYVMDVEQGTNCVLSVSYHNQTFDRVWDLGAVTYPQANKNFYNTTLTECVLEVVGGEDKYPIGAFDVTVRSTDDLYETFISSGGGIWMGGSIGISNIPPLEYNVIVVPNPDNSPGDPFGLGINSQFMDNNSKYIDLRYPDDSVDTLSFVWRNPLTVELIWSPALELQYLSDDLDEEYGFYVLDQNEWVDVHIQAYEDYSFDIFQGRKTYQTHCEIEIIDEVGFYRDISTGFGGQTQYTHSFAPYLPNITGGEYYTRPYQNMLEVTVQDQDLNRFATSTDWVLTQGARPTESTFATTSPQIPMLILHDPPGDASYASFKQTSTTSNAMSVNFSSAALNGEMVTAKLGPTIVSNMGFLFSVQTEFDFIVDSQFGTSFRKQQSVDNEVVVTISTTEEFRTSSQDQLIGKESDLYVGAAVNLIWGITRELIWDADTRIPTLDYNVMVIPDGFDTVFMYTENQILLNVIPNLIAIGDTTSAGLWQSYVDMNTYNMENGVDNPSHPANISFNAGAGYMYEHSETTTESTTFAFETTVSEEFGQDLGLVVNGVGGIYGFSFGTEIVWGNSTTETYETNTTITFELADDDETSYLNNQADYFTIDIKKDPVYGTPVFNLLAGASSNRWEPNTMPRDGVYLSANTYSIAGLQPGEEAAFLLYLSNTSQTNEDRRYFLTVHHAQNPWGATININGLPVVEKMPVDIPGGETVQLVMTIAQSPLAYEYQGITVELYAEGDRGNPGPDGHHFYIEESFNAYWEPPYSRVSIHNPHANWIVNQSNDNILNITLGGYDLSKPTFQTIKLQYKRPYHSDWLTAFEIDREYLDDYPNYVVYPWDLSSLSDGPYEIRAGTTDSVMPDYYTAPLLGYVDRIPPDLLMPPEPQNGILSHGGVISASFTEYIDANSIDPLDFSLIYVQTGIEIDISVTCFENRIYILPNVSNYWLENQILRATINNLSDLRGNPLAEPIVWEFYVNANPVSWTQPRIELIKPLGETASVTAHLHNAGGNVTSFSLDNIPEWLIPNMTGGSLFPLETKTILFTISDQLGYGTHRDTLYADVPSLGREPLVFEVSVLANPPAWATTQLDTYEYSMTITGQLCIDGDFSVDTNDLIGAFVLDASGSYICRGVASVQSVPYLVDTFLFFLTVHSDEEDGEELIFRVWDSSSNKEHYGVQEEFMFLSGAVYGTPLDPVIVNAMPELITTIGCRNGWTWFSVNLFSDESMDLNDVLAPLSPEPNDIIKNQSLYAQYVPGQGWVGSLQEIGTTDMYKIKLTEEDELLLIGLLEDPEETIIDYSSGWNWIGYLPHVSISVNQAMANLSNPTSGDLIKNQTGYSQYIEGYGWFGSLLFMKPGDGYMLKTAESGTFNYPNYIIPRDEEEPPFDLLAYQRMRELTGWEINAQDYEYSSNITAVINADGTILNSSDLLLGAFYGDECRGVAIPVQVVDQWVLFLTQYSNVNNQLLSYKVYFEDTEMIVDIDQVLPFINNQVLGSPMEPFEFSITLGSLEPPANVQLQIIGNLLQLSWDEVPGASSYRVFASDSPTGQFIDITHSGYFEDPPRSIDTGREQRQRKFWYCEVPNDSRKFFRITAYND